MLLLCPVFDGVDRHIECISESIYLCLSWISEGDASESNFSSHSRKLIFFFNHMNGHVICTQQGLLGGSRFKGPHKIIFWT